MFDQSVYHERVQTLQKKLEPNSFALFSDPSHITYLTGFEFLLPNEREAFLLCSSDQSILLHTAFSPLPDLSFVSCRSGVSALQLKLHLEAIISDTKNVRLYFDPTTLFVSEYLPLLQFSELQIAELQPQLITGQMEIKAPEEITAIQTACAHSQTVYKMALEQLSFGVTEQEIAEYIAQELRKLGCEQLAFPTIVAFGKHTALPHHQPSTKKLTENTPVLIDMGGQFQGYCADMTRTIWFGATPDSEFLKIETIVMEAYAAAFAAATSHAKTPVFARTIDNSARTHIANQGFGEKFTHTTGHGVGLKIHESPSLNWTNTQQLHQNMSITIEPGIYLENKFGYRYENTILMTKAGANSLTGE